MRETSPGVLIMLVFAAGGLAACESREYQPPADAATPAADAAASWPDAAAGDTAPAPDVLDPGADSAALEAGVEAPPAPDMAPTGCVPEGEVRRVPAENGTVAGLDEFATLTFNSNPPSSGRHCEQAGQYGGYTEAQPLSRCNYLKNLELGGVALVYNCPGGCNDVTAQLARAIVDVRDPDCATNKRVLVTPDKDLDVKVAATAWGFTWRASCLDTAARASLVKFINDHIGSNGEAPMKAAKVCQ
jgi:hypothetical protein